MEEALLEFRDISKSFGSVYALRGVSLRVRKGEVIALLGDNGAGKSTLIKILSGVYSPDSGEILVRGERVQHWSAARARRSGIETVYQDKALAEQQSVVRNIFMGRERTNRLGFLKVREEREEAERLMRHIGFTSQVFSPESEVGRLSGGEREGVAIARALYFNAELIILDEPTSALSLTEARRVIEFVKRARDEGASAIFITHTIYHAYDVADRIVVLDRGEIVLEIEKAAIGVEDLIARMEGIARHGKHGAAEGGADRGDDRRSG
jgi:simple sugar transport system ATP-binding protein